MLEVLGVNVLLGWKAFLRWVRVHDFTWTGSWKHIWGRTAVRKKASNLDFVPFAMHATPGNKRSNSKLEFIELCLGPSRSMATKCGLSASLPFCSTPKTAPCHQPSLLGAYCPRRRGASEVPNE